MTVVWDQVTKAEVLRAVQEYDRLGPEKSAAQAIVGNVSHSSQRPGAAAAGRP